MNSHAVHRLRPFWTTVLFAALLAAPATADVVTIVSSKDNTLYENIAGALSNGAGSRLFTGKTSAGSIRRAVLAFDVAGSLPSGSTVNSATLRLYVSRTIAGTTPVAVHRLSVNWGEGTSDASGQEGSGDNATTGDATWIHTFYPFSPWGSAGGDYTAMASATTSVGGLGFYTWSSGGLALDVQDWLDTPATNFGWIVIGDESSSETAKRFDSRQNNTASQRPQLTINFTPPGVTGACCFGDGSCLSLSAAECASMGGTYQGNGVSCTPNPCPEPTGACCIDGVPCSIQTAADCAVMGGSYQGDGMTCSPDPCPVDLTPFVDELPLPAVAQPITGTIGGEAHYAIAMTEFQQQLHRDLPPTTLWGYGGTYPGPTIEAGVGLPISVEWINDLRDAQGDLRTEHFLPVDLCPHGPDMAGNTPRTVVHLHGGHVPTASDGYPEATILPGESTVYEYPNLQLPATLWYHDHAIGITRLNVYLGMAAFYLLRDDFEMQLDLPAGTYEIPLAIQDRTFLQDGSLVYPAAWEEHFFGDTMLVNGKVWPYLDVNRGKYRFRIVNGCNARTLRLSLSNAATFHQIGSDGGLLPAPVALTEVTLAPAERADLVINFAGYAPGTEIVLQNSAPAPYPGTPGVGVVPEVMKFVVQPQGGHTNALPALLRPIETLSEGSAIEHRDFELRRFSEPCAGTTWLINDLGWEDITEFPLLGTTEVWSFANRSGTVHPMHMHLVMFQVLDRQSFDVVGGEIVPSGPRVPPNPEEAGWKDTVKANPMEITRVIARFEDYTGLYAYHCHILEHEDHEMMRQFRVVLPRDVPDRAPGTLRRGGR